MTTDKLECAPENAERFATWLRDRGGIAVWRSANLSNPGASWSTPRLDPMGGQMTKPTWQAQDIPERIVVDPADVEVLERIEVKRVPIALRRSGTALKLTDASSRRVREQVAKAGDGAWHEFDHEHQQAVIYKPGKATPLLEYLAKVAP